MREILEDLDIKFTTVFWCIGTLAFSVTLTLGIAKEVKESRKAEQERYEWCVEKTDDIFRCKDWAKK